MRPEKIQAALEKINKETLNKVLSDADLDAVSGGDAVSWLPDSMHFAVCDNCKKAYFVNPETCPHCGKPTVSRRNGDIPNEYDLENGVF